MDLFEIVANVLGIDASTLSDESNGKNTANWDSARHIDLMLAVEIAYDTQFTMPEITSMQNLGDMRRLLEQKGAFEKAA